MVNDNYTQGLWSEMTDENGDVWVLAGKEKPGGMHSYFIGNLEDTCSECHGNAELIMMAPVLNAALMIAAVRAYQAEIVDTEMYGLIEETRTEWIADRVEEWITEAEEFVKKQGKHERSKRKRPTRK
jgi:hypothetical protein